jgi:ribonuclease HI
MMHKGPGITSHLKIIQINLQHSKTASASLAQLLLDKQIDAAIIQEPYVSVERIEKTISLPDVPPGYSSFHNITSDYMFGTAIIAKSHLNGSLISSLSHNSTTAITISTPQGPFHLLSMYARPSATSPFSAFSLFLNHPHLFPNIVIGLDSNAKHPLWNSRSEDKKGQELISVLSRLPLSVANSPISELTFTPSNTAFIDITLTGDNILCSQWSFLDYPSLSDHPYITYMISHGSTSSPNYPKQNISSCKSLPKLVHINFELLTSSLSPLHVTNCPQTSCEKNIDTTTATITGLLQSAVRSATINPRKKTLEKKMPWWSPKLWALRHQLKRSQKNFRESRTPLNKAIFREAKATYQREIRKAKKEHWIRFLQLMNTDHHAAIKEITKKVASVHLPTSTIINGITVNDQKEILKHCSSLFFPLDAPTTPSQLPCLERSKSLISQPLLFSSEPITSNELKAATSSLKISSAAGPDGLYAELIIKCLPFISTELLALLNRCIKSCYFPASWRHAKVHIISKQNKSDYSNLCNFRPISVVNIFAKIFEKVILGRLKWHAYQHSWFHDNQHGFIPGRSTETAAHQLTNYIESGFMKNSVTAAAFLDIKAAFDTAWHPAIIVALASKGCPPYLVKIIHSFLSNRKATLTSNSSEITINISTGCPQGSVLSAFLWITLIDDLLRLIFPFPVLIIAYADDLTIAVTHSDPEIAVARLQSVCNAILNWCVSVKLVINALKTNFMLFSRRRTKSTFNPVIEIGDVKVPASSTGLFLGITLDSKLSWHQHIENKNLSIRRLCFLINRYVRRTWGLSPSRIKAIYKALIIPKWLYCCSVWASATNRSVICRKLRSLQRTFATFMTRCPCSTSTEALLTIAGLQPIDYTIRQICAFRYCLSIPHHIFSPLSKTIVQPIFRNSLIILPADTSKLHVSAPWSSPASVTILAKQTPSLPVFAQSPQTLRVFTDGSKVNDKIGYGVAIFDEYALLHTCKGRLSGHASVFQAESSAILTALHFILKYYPDVKRIELLSDSLAALSSIVSTEKIPSTFIEIRKLLASHSHIYVTFFWIPSHQGHSGNELADELAKDATNLPFITDLTPPPPSYIKQFIEAQLTATWNKEWSLSKKSAITHDFLPSVTLQRPIATLHKPFLLCKVISGHAPLNYHLHRIGKAQSPLCSCKLAEESTLHFLFDCPNLDAQRSAFKSAALMYIGSWPPPLISITQIPQILHALLNFLELSLRLRRRTL